MKQESTFTNYDFTNVWDFNGLFNEGYPILRSSQQIYTGGSIPLTDCDILNTDGATYTLQNNVNGPASAHCFIITANNVKFNGGSFTIDGTSTASDYSGIYVTGDNAEIYDVTLKDYDAAGNSEGITLYQSDGSKVRDCTFNSNNDGIFVVESTNSNVSHNTFTSNSDINIALQQSNDSYVGYNTITNGGYGVRLYVSVLDSLIEHNSISSVSGSGVRLQSNFYYNPDQRTTIQYNNITNSGWGVEFATNSTDTVMINNKITSITNREIQDQFNTEENLQLIYNNSQGQIEWTGSEMTTGAMVVGDLEIGNSIILENNNIGLDTSVFDFSTWDDINSSATIIFRNIGFTPTKILKNGVFYSDTGITNLGGNSYQISVPGFSNYSLDAADCDPSDLCCDATGSYHTAGTDPEGECDVVYTGSAGDCSYTVTPGTCNGAGACTSASSQNVAANKVFNGVSAEVDATSTGLACDSVSPDEYAGGVDDCTYENRYAECDGSGSCDINSDTYYQLGTPGNVPANKIITVFGCFGDTCQLSFGDASSQGCDLSIDYWTSAGDCSADGRYAECNGAGSCDTDASNNYQDTTNTNIAANKVAAGQNGGNTVSTIDASSLSNSCSGTINEFGSGSADCSIDQYLSECTGTGICDVSGSVNGQFYQTVPVTAGKILTGGHGRFPDQTSTVTEGDASSGSTCDASADTNYYSSLGDCTIGTRYSECNGAGACDTPASTYYATGTAYNVPANKVAAGQFGTTSPATIDASSTSNSCDYSIDYWTSAGDCVADGRYAECNGAGSCDTDASTNYQDTTNSNIAANKVAVGQNGGNTVSTQDASSTSNSCDGSIDYLTTVGDCTADGRYAECNGAGVCDNDASTNYQDTTDSNIAANKVASGQSGGNTVSTIDASSTSNSCDSSIDYWTSAGDCVADGRYAECNGAGACDTDASTNYQDTTNTNIAANKVASGQSGGNTVSTQDASSTSNSCDGSEDYWASAGDCVSNRRYAECNGAGVCDTDASTNYQSGSTVNIAASQVAIDQFGGNSVLTGDATNAATACDGDSNYYGSVGDCSYGNRFSECNGAGSCDTAATTYYGEDVTNVAAGKVYSGTGTSEIDASGTGNSCDGSVDNWATANECTYNSRWAECDGVGICDSDASTYYTNAGNSNIQSGYVATTQAGGAGTPEIIGSSSNYASTDSADRCSLPSSPALGFGDAEYDVFACDGSGGTSGPDVGDLQTDCTTGCCYDAGATASCQSSGTSGTIDYYDFGLGDSGQTDYCLSAEVLDCFDSSDCEAGFACIGNVCTDAIDPEQNYLQPDNDTETTDQTVTFEVNTTDNIGLDNSTLYIYNSSDDLYDQRTNILGGVTESLVQQVVVLVDDLYTWFFEIFDTSGNSIVTENRTLTVDEYEGGTGTEVDPYEIDTCQELQFINKDLTASYELIADIDCSGYDFTAIGVFTGDLFGNNHTVTGLTISKGTNDVGLFHETNGATINNLGLINVNVTGSLANAGGLVGQAISTTIDSVYTTGEVYAGAAYVGGIVGQTDSNTVISNSYSLATVSAGTSTVGGLVGYLYNSDVQNSYAVSDVSSGSVNGGLIGILISGTVNNSFSAGTVANSANSGDLVGQRTGGTILDSFAYDGSNNNGCVGSGSLTGCTSIPDLWYFYEHNNYPMADWDFQTVGAGIWDRVEGASPTYPALTWQGIGEGMLWTNPFHITTCSQLQDMDENLTAEYVLDNDINCTYSSTWNSGAGFDPVGTLSTPFNGNLSGDNHTVFDLTFNRSQNKMGLIGYSDSVVINNIGLMNVNVTETGSSDETSALLGECNSLGSGCYISKSFVNGYISSPGSGVGLILGVGKAFIDDCYSIGEVNAGLTAGGIVGDFSGGYINNSYSLADVTVVGSAAGGLTGDNGGAIYNSFSIGNVTSGLAEGAISSSGGTLSNIYWYNHSGNPDSCYSGGNTGCTAKTDINYFKEDVYPLDEPFTSWDFFSTWEEKSSDYPVLTWQATGTDLDTTGPRITFLSPIEGTFYSVDYVDLNWTTSEATGVDSCTYEFDSNGTIIPISTNITLTDLVDAHHNITMVCNDTLGNVGTSVVEFDIATITFENFQFYALNSSQEIIGGSEAFNTTNLEEIEYMNISFTANSGSGFTEDITLYYTANGAGACSLGNKQSSTCYNFDTPANQWIVFQNGTETSTFKDEGNAGDYISCSYVANVGDYQRNYTCQIDEHYNPNVFKWYDAGYDFNEVKWQNGTDQRLNEDRIIRVDLSGIVPLDADQYKLDFRVQPTSAPNAPVGSIYAHACNSSYTTGDPATSPECALIAARTVDQLQDNGNKFRGIFTKQLVDQLGDGKYIVISTDENNANRYFALKTYNITNGGHTVKWEYSGNRGSTWNTPTDGYETEMNVNWFYNGADPTQINFMIEGTDGIYTRNSSVYNMTWDIDPTQNYEPVLEILHPENEVYYKGTIDINWTTVDPNDDRFTTNITATNGTSTVNILTDAADTISTTTWDTTAVADGTWNITVESCENETILAFCVDDTHSIYVDNTAPSTTINDTNSNYRGTDVTFTLTCDDGIGSGCNTIAYEISPYSVVPCVPPTTDPLTGFPTYADYNEYSSAVTFGNESGHYQVCYVSYDNLAQSTTPTINKQDFRFDQSDVGIVLLEPQDDDTKLSTDTDINFTANLTDTGTGLDNATLFIYDGTTICEQETANVSEVCGALATGSYSTSGHPFITPANLYDGNYGTSTSISSRGIGDPTEAILQIDYAKPDGALSATLQYKTGTSTSNVTIPADCFERDPVQIQFISASNDLFESGYYVKCYNGSSWNTLAGGMDSLTTYSPVLYEETMYWLAPDLGTSYNETTVDYSGETQSVIGIVVSLLEDVYYWFYTAFDIFGHKTTSETRTLLVNTIPVVTTPTIVPSPAANNQQLNCSTTATDVNSHNMNVSFKWYVNGMWAGIKDYYNTGGIISSCTITGSTVEQTKCYDSIFTNGQIYNSYLSNNINANNCLINQTYLEGPFNLYDCTIHNGYMSAGTIEIDGVNYTAPINFSDRWQENLGVTTGSTTSDTLESSETIYGTTTCVVQAYDGYEYSIAQNSSVTVRSTGTGTPEDPFLIVDCEGLQFMQNNLSAYYELGNDIDCSGHNFVPIGNLTAPFTGSLNGANNTISNLLINNPTGNNVGLFGYLTGNVTSLGLNDATVIGDNVVGALVGTLGIGGNVGSCYSTGSVNASGDYGGGLVGFVAGTVSESYSQSTVNVDGNNAGGGFGAVTVGGIVQNTYASGEVNAGGTGGGLVGSVAGSTTTYTNINSESPTSYRIMNTLVDYIETNLTPSVSVTSMELYMVRNAPFDNTNYEVLVNDVQAFTFDCNDYTTAQWYSFDVSSSLFNVGSSNTIKIQATEAISNNKIEIGVTTTGGSNDYWYKDSVGTEELGVYMIKLIGTGAGGTVDSSFGFGNVTATPEGSVVGNSVDGTLTNLWGYSGEGNPTSCVGSAVGSVECISIPLDWFFYGHNNPPMESWDFGTGAGTGTWDWNEGPIIGLPYLTWQGLGEDMVRASPLHITTCSQLQDMELNLSDEYQLDNTIDCQFTIYWNGGAGFDPVGTSSNKFTGSLNGRNNTIDDLYIDRTDSYEGLFGYLDSAVVNDLGFNDANVTGDSAVGILFARADNSNISRSFTKGYVQTNTVTTIGGFGGFIGVGTNIQDSYSTAQVADYNGISAASYMGGFIGISYGTINNSYATGNITNEGTSTDNVGGFVGRTDLDGGIYNSFSTGVIASNSGIYVNNFIGKDGFDSSVSNSYSYSGSGNPPACSDTQTGCTSKSDITYFQGNVYLSTPPMRSWSFFDIWEENTNDYPTLTWESTGSSVVDIVPPSATLIVPTNNSYTNNPNVNFTVNLSDDHAIKNATLYVYNSSDDLVNETTEEYSEVTTSEVFSTIVNLVDNVYTWFLRLFDWDDNSFTTGNNTFTLDTEAPTINALNTSLEIVSYDYYNNTHYQTTANAFSFRATSNSVSKLNYTQFYSDGVLDSSSLGINQFSANFTYPVVESEGPHNVSFTAYDLAGNSASSPVLYYTIDLTDPVVTIQHPVNTTYYDTNLIDLNWTVVEINLDSCTYSLDEGAGVPISSDITLGPLSDSPHNVSITCTDLSGRSHTSDLIEFTVDTTNPSVTMLNPVDTEHYGTASVDLNWTVSDTNFNNCSYNLDAVGDVFTLDCTQENANESTGCGDLSTGTYTVVGSVNNPENFYDNDINTWASLTAASSGFYINYSIPDAAAGATWTYSNGGFNTNVSVPQSCLDYDGETLQIRWIGGGRGTTVRACYDGVWQTMASDGVLTPAEESITWDITVLPNITMGPLTHGEHNVSLTCYDLAGNSNTTDLAEFFVDLLPPTVSIVHPINGSIFNETTFDLNYTSSDDSIYSCTYEIDQNGTDVPISTNVTLGPLTRDDHNISMTCTDEFGYSTTTDLVEIIVSKSPTAPIGSYFNNASFASQELNVTGVGATDPEGDPLTYYYEFRCDSATGPVVQAWSTDNSWVINKNCSWNHTVYAIVGVTDGHSFSLSNETLSRAINDSPITAILSVDSMPAIDLISGGNKTAYTTFTVEDLDGDINLSATWIDFTRPGQDNITSDSCAIQSTTINTTTINCTTQFPFYTNHVTWSLYIYVEDLGGTQLVEDTETYTVTVNELNSIGINITNIDFGSIQVNTDDIAGSPIQINNLGNVAFTDIGLEAFDLEKDENNSIAVQNNMCVNSIADANTGCQELFDGIPVVISGASLPVGATSNEIIYTYMDVPNIERGLYSAYQNWVIYTS
jgi:parallel beta-helix repeat protein